MCVLWECLHVVEFLFRSYCVRNYTAIFSSFCNIVSCDIPICSFGHFMMIDSLLQYRFVLVFSLYTICIVKQPDVYISWKFYCFYVFWTKILLFKRILIKSISVIETITANVMSLQRLFKINRFWILRPCRPLSGG